MRTCARCRHGGRPSSQAGRLCRAGRRCTAATRPSGGGSATIRPQQAAARPCRRRQRRGHRPWRHRQRRQRRHSRRGSSSPVCRRGPPPRRSPLPHRQLLRSNPLCRKPCRSRCPRSLRRRSRPLHRHGRIHRWHRHLAHASTATGWQPPAGTALLEVRIPAVCSTHAAAAARSRAARERTMRRASNGGSSSSSRG